jgi:cytochrome c553
MPRPKWHRVAFSLTAVVLLAACSERGEDVQIHMQEHFEKASEVHAAIIQGDLDAARGPAGWIMEHEPIDKSRPSWDPYVETLRGAADQVRQAPDLQTAAMAASVMVRTCGSCHEALSDGVTFSASPLPPSDLSTVSHMQRHNWAAERMWEGLAIPSQEAWAQGIQSLAEVPLRPETLSPDSALAPQVAALVEQVHDLGEEGAQAVSWRTRTSVYGRLIATCASCHGLVSAGPS